MSRSPARPLTTLLRNVSQSQQQLMHKAQRLLHMQTQLHKLLPDDLAPHVQVANLRGDRLVLTADSSTWASRLRYQSVDLLAQLRAAGWRCQRLEVKVAPSHSPFTKQQVKRSLSPETRRLLRQTADHIGDPEMAATLKNIAQHDEPTD